MIVADNDSRSTPKWAINRQRPHYLTNRAGSWGEGIRSTWVLVAPNVRVPTKSNPLSPVSIISTRLCVLVNDMPIRCVTNETDESD
jgi:hypothetical protein